MNAPQFVHRVEGGRADRTIRTAYDLDEVVQRISDVVEHDS